MRLMLLVFVFISACNSPVEPMENTEVDAKLSAEAAMLHKLEGSYIKVTGRDTVRLQLKVVDSAVTGTMEFDNFEKDSSHGSVKGNVKNDRLYVWYNFSSERYELAQRTGF